MSYIGNEPIVSATRTVTEIVATAGQTVFTANGGYTVGYLDVFVNGAQLQNTDFTATNGSTVTLGSPAQSGDDIRLVAWGTFSTGTHVLKAGDTMSGGLNVLGNLGVGTSSPAVSIDARKSGDVQIRAFETGISVDNRLVSVGGAGQAGIVGTYSNHPLVVYTNGTERFRVPSNAGGIQFPAAQSASSDPNTLDDYEEGTWTPQLQFNGAATGMTYSKQVGRYTKIGRIVSLQFNIKLSNKGSSTGTATIVGTPFPGFNGPANNAPMQNGFVVNEVDGSSWPTAPYGLIWNDSRIYLRFNNGTGIGEMTSSNFTNSTEFYYSCTYEIS